MKLASLLLWIVTILVFSSLVLFFSSESRDQLAEAERTYVRKGLLLERLNSLPERERYIKNRLADLDGEAPNSFLYEGTELEVRAFLQRDIRQKARSHQLSIRNMRPIKLDVSESDLLKSTGVQISFVTDYETLIFFLKDIEDSKPLLRIHKLSTSIHTPSTTYKAATLTVTLDVVAFLYGNGGSDA